jgi:hypothetical protein
MTSALSDPTNKLQTALARTPTRNAERARIVPGMSCELMRFTNKKALEDQGPACIHGMFWRGMNRAQKCDLMVFILNLLSSLN